MVLPIKPLPGYIVVKQEEAQTKTASGIYLPDAAKEKSKVAEILALGAGVTDLKVGDRIVYKNEYDATEVKVGTEDYTLVEAKNVIAIVKK